MANVPSLWQPSTTGLNDPANWTAGKPDAGIDSIFGPADADATSDMATNAPAAIITRPDYRGHIGASGSPWVHALSTGRYLIQHPGAFWWGSGATAVTQMIINKGAGHGRGEAQLLGSVGRLYCLSGQVTCQASHTWGAVSNATWLFMTGNQTRLTIQAASGAETLPGLVRMMAGELTNHRDFTSADQVIEVSNGRLLQYGLLKSTMRLHITGGTVVYEPSSDPSGEAPYIFVDHGILDVRNSQWSIPTTSVEIGPGGVILGNAIDRGANFYDLDMNLPYP